MYHVPALPAARSLTPKDQDPDAATLPAGLGAPDTSRRPLASLRLIATSDLHASLMPYDYCADRPNTNLGLGDSVAQIG